MSTLDIIVQRFGVMLTVQDAADVFRTSVQSLRMQLARENNLGEALNKIKIKKDRRILFPATGVARIIDGTD
jgi:hypothetical protein